MNDWHELGLTPDSPPQWVNGPRLDAIRRIVEDAPGIVASVPYQVSLRWLFYRLLQDGYFEGIKTKADSYRWFLNTVRRPAVYSGLWTPDMVTDEGRNPISGEGWKSPGDWLDYQIKNMSCNLDSNIDQEHYVMLAFEANAMADQFRFYTEDYSVTLWPFGGDPSIPYKFRLARWIERVSREFDLPTLILYFGDLDTKGSQIPESAFYRIHRWCAEPFKAYRIGLNPGDEIRFDIPEQPDKPGAYQWEALNDDAAREIIVGALEQVFDDDTLAETRELSNEFSAKAQKALAEIGRSLR